jgi:23S rRNA (cytosine1962-C5)-methyltransferase
MPYEIYLKKNEEKRIVNGHSWVYANEVQKIEGKDKNGTLATVYDNSGRYIGKGFINHASKILVRIFIRDNREADKQLFLERIKIADDYRKKLGFNDCYRVVFGEADNLPALIIDKYHDIFCVQFLSLGMDKIKNIIKECLIELFSPRGIYERSDAQVREKEGLPLINDYLYGEFETRVTVEENGLKMLCDLKNGQKTGYFLDQKENRQALRRYVKDANVLDCFCNSGGFSLNAAAGGAKKVTALDISQTALNDVIENAKINGYSDIINTIQGDVFKVLRDYKSNSQTFDVIVLDPPAFTKSASQVTDALRGYKDINILAMKLVNKGGFLITSSCSHYVTLPLFMNMLETAASESGKIIRCIEIRSQSADHPSLLAADETMYLKYIVLHIL